VETIAIAVPPILSLYINVLIKRGGPSGAAATGFFCRARQILPHRYDAELAAGSNFSDTPFMQ
jgi:hypothetical protein